MNDKELHFIAGAAVYGAVSLTSLEALAVVVGVALLKEVYDGLSGRGVPEIEDFASTCLGGLVAKGLIG